MSQSSEVSFYDAVGGHDTFVQIVDRFYQGVAQDPVLKPMYPEDDLRPAADYRAGHLAGARSVPMGELDRRVAEIPTSPMVVLYCRCTVEEAATAYAYLETRGYTNHVVLQEGHDGWVRRRFPLVR